LTVVSEVLTVAIINAVMEAVSTSETSVSFYETARCHVSGEVNIMLVAVRTRNLTFINIAAGGPNRPV
jgi:hypothetical protein